MQIETTLINTLTVQPINRTAIEEAHLWMSPKYYGTCMGVHLLENYLPLLSTVVVVILI